jgi:hypothetical protein
MSIQPSLYRGYRFPLEGGVVDLDFMRSHQETNLIAIDEQADDNVVHLGRLGKADRFARKPLDTRTQRQMFPLNLLRVAFPRHMNFRGQMPSLRPPLIGEEARDAKGFQQGLELQEDFVLATAKHICQDLSGPVIESMPQPTRLLLLPHEALHFVDLRGLHSANAHFYVTGS